MKVIVLGCYSKIALAVINDLAGAGHELIGGAARETGFRLLRPGSFLRSRHLSGIFHYAHPGENERRFLEDLIRACKRYDAQVLIPVGQAVTVHASKFKREIEAASGTCVPIADYETLSRFADKWKTFELASELDVPCPRTLLLQPSELGAVEFLRYPVVVKPRHLTGGEGVSFFASFEELSQNIEDQPSRYRRDGCGEYPYIVQEKIDGELHDVVLIARGGVVGPILTQRRVMTLYDFGGGGIINKTTFEPAAMELAERVVRQTRWSGPLMFDFIKRGDDDYVLLECNPRFWGTTRVAVEAGLPLGQDLVDLLVHQKSVVRNESYTRDYVFKFIFPDCVYSWMLRPWNPGAIVARVRKTMSRHGGAQHGNNLKLGDLRHILGFLLHGREH